VIIKKYVSFRAEIILIKSTNKEDKNQVFFWEERNLCFSLLNRMDPITGLLNIKNNLPYGIL